MRCFLDMDGVLVDFLGGALRHHALANPYDHAENHGKWEFWEVVGLEPAAFWAPLGREFWANLEWTDDGHRILAMLEHHFGPEKIALLTSPPETDGCIDGKRDWVQKHLPAYKRRLIVTAAKEFFAHPGAVLVDDSDRNVAGFAAASGQGVLVPRPWNKGHRLGGHMKISDHFGQRLAEITRDEAGCWKRGRRLLPCT